MVTRNSVNSIIGNLSEFKPENDWNGYIEPMKLFFLANSIEDDNKKKLYYLVPVFLTHTSYSKV